MRALRLAVRALTVPALATVLALAVGAVVVGLSGHDPLAAYRGLAVGAGLDYPLHWLPGNPLGVDATLARADLVATILRATPLALAGLGVAVGLRAGLLNLGGAGQYWVGAVAALAVVGRLSLPGPLLAALGLLAAVLAAGLYAAIGGVLKAARGVPEAISTALLAWIAVDAARYLVRGPLRGDTGDPASLAVPRGARLPVLSGDVRGIHVGVILALAALVAVPVILRRSVLGYELRASGLNPDAARAAGIATGHLTVVAMALSGALVGLAGAGEVLGVSHQVGVDDVAPLQIGLLGVAVALLGRLTAPGMLLAALLFGALQSAGGQLGHGLAPGLATPLAMSVEGTLLLVVAGERLVRRVAERRPARTWEPRLDEREAALA